MKLLFDVALGPEELAYTGICVHTVRTGPAVAVQRISADGRPPNSRSRPSASLATVRRLGAAKPLSGLDFGRGADAADGADGRAAAQ